MRESPPPPPPLIPFVSKVKKVEKAEGAEGAEVDKTEHIKLEFFIDPRQPGFQVSLNALLSSRMGALRSESCG